MARATLEIDLTALAENWRRLNSLTASSVETAAVVKSNAYGLGIGPVASTLSNAGTKSFFVALAEEAQILRPMLGGSANIYILSGYMKGDLPLLDSRQLVPVMNSIEQLDRFLSDLPDHPFAVQIDTGMNRLGIDIGEFQERKAQILAHKPVLILSHLANSDDVDASENWEQLSLFKLATEGCNARRSIAATGGILLGPEFHQDLCRPGIGLYGGLPFSEARRVVNLSLPVVQVQTVLKGEAVGYGGEWKAESDTRVATLLAGYADGIFRNLGNRANVYSKGTACPVVGRISMDLVTVDVTHLDFITDKMQIIGPDQTIDDLARDASTIGYEVLTSLGERYERTYQEK